MCNLFRQYIFLFFLLLCLPVKSQDVSRLDSVLANAETPKEKFDALVELSDYWSYKDTARAFDMLRRALPLVQDNAFLQGKYYFYEAGVYFGYDNDKSKQLYMLADKYLERDETPESYRYRARLWHNYGVLEQMANNDKEFLDITLTRCIPYAEKLGDTDLLMGYFTDVGLVFYNHKEYEKALDYYMKAVSLVKTPDDETGNLLWVYLNIFEVHLYRGDMAKAQHALDKAEKLLEALPDKKLAGIFYKHKAKLFNVGGDYRSALQSIDEGLRVAREYNFTWDIISLNYEKAQVYKVSGDWQNARMVLMDLLQGPEHETTFKSRLALMNELSEVESRLGNFEQAYELMKSYKTLNDSLNLLNYKEQIADLETRYRTAEKEQAILILESKNRFQLTLIIAAVFIVLLLALWFWYSWYNRKKRIEKDMLLLKQQREIELSKALMAGEKQERTRLARDLHDGLVGRVTAVKMNLERLARDNNSEGIDDIIPQMDTVIRELRHTAHNLEPVALDKLGLEGAIRHFCQSLESEKYQLTFYARGLNGIEDKSLQSSVYRIAQELVSNAVRHAEASEITLQCTFENNFLLMEIEDNGKGFDTAATPRNMGLNNLESRVKLIGGTMSIDSQHGRGTSITIECKL